MQTVWFSKRNKACHFNLLESIQKALDDGKIPCGIFIDLEKVFDTAFHDNLLENLDHDGVRGISNVSDPISVIDLSLFISMILTLIVKL